MARGTSPTSLQGQKGPVSWYMKLRSPPDTERRCFTRCSKIVHARHAVRKKPEEYDPLAGGGLLPGSEQACPFPRSLSLSLSLRLSAFDCGEGEGEEDAAPAAASDAPSLSRPFPAFREGRSFSRAS